MAENYPRITQFLLGAASFVVIVIGMQMAESILVPFLLALFLAVISASPFFWLKRHKVPSWLAMLLVLLVVIGFMAGITLLVGNSVNQFLNQVPRYQERLMEQTRDLVVFLKELGFDITFDAVTEFFNPGTIMQLSANALQTLSSVLTNVFLILMMVIIMMIESLSLPDKMRAALKKPQPYLDFIEKFNDTIEHYMLMKTTLNLITGILVAVLLSVLGVDFPILWGVFAFLLNYIPNFGSIIASVPAILLAWVDGGLGVAAGTGIGYIVINGVMGNVIEPRFMGRTMGLSILVVFLSLVFWNWVLGPVGMLLSVPLTMTFKIALEASPQTRWIAILLDDKAPDQAEISEIE